MRSQCRQDVEHSLESMETEPLVVIGTGQDVDPKSGVGAGSGGCFVIGSGVGSGDAGPMRLRKPRDVKVESGWLSPLSSIYARG